MTHHTKPIKTVLSYPNKTIALLRLQIKQQLALLEHVKKVLPKELASHALHCVFHDKTPDNKKLLVYTDSATWASQLRFYGKAMLTSIEPVAPTPISVIQVKIISAAETANTPKKRIAVIPSQTAAEDINNLSCTVTDPQLKQALDKLSSTLIRLHSRNN